MANSELDRLNSEDSDDSLRYENTTNVPPGLTLTNAKRLGLSVASLLLLFTAGKIFLQDTHSSNVPTRSHAISGASSSDIPSPEDTPTAVIVASIDFSAISNDAADLEQYAGKNEKGNLQIVTIANVDANMLKPNHAHDKTLSTPDGNSLPVWAYDYTVGDTIYEFDVLAPDNAPPLAPDSKYLIRGLVQLPTSLTVGELRKQTSMRLIVFTVLQIEPQTVK